VSHIKSQPYFRNTNRLNSRRKIVTVITTQHSHTQLFNVLLYRTIPVTGVRVLELVA